MRGPIRSILLAALAVCAFAAIPAVQASAATMEDEGTAMLAIYGNPGINGASVPVGGGLGRNFGFGKNMLFQACEGCTHVPAIGKNLKIEINATVAEAKDTYIGGRLMSNKTGANNPLSFKIEFVDFQDNFLGGVATPSYADTSDRPWITEICSPAAVGEACKTDAQYTQGNKPGGVKIENVSFALVTAGGPIVVQGTVWGLWENSSEAGKPPCITLEKPAVATTPTLVVTQTFAGGPAIGAAATKVEGKACLISANNDWYNVKTGEVKEPAVTIANT
jgi:opacity protein-like surface antigen